MSPCDIPAHRFYRQIGSHNRAGEVKESRSHEDRAICWQDFGDASRIDTMTSASTT